MKKSSVSRSLAAVLASTLLLAACGGGGGGGPRPPTSSQFSEAVAGCAVPTQRQFVRTYLDEVYLWYREIPTVDPNQYTTVASISDYFDALTNLPQDRFSQAVASGKHATTLQSANAQLTPGRLLAAGSVATSSVITSTTGKRVAYVQLRDHAEGAQDELIAAFTQLQNQAPIHELILDLRDNTGGFVYVALTAASMITGPSKNGQIFERLVFNDKRGESTLSFSGTVQFPDASNPVFRPGTQLPQLNLQRVFLLTNDPQTDPIGDRGTCSASESIINSLRGVNVQTVRVGETTCGKPYGFSEKVNCGWSFFAIEFQGFNAQGFGDYQGGFAPTCAIADTTRASPSVRGTSTDAIFNGAMHYIDNAACPPGVVAGTSGVQSASTPIVSIRKRSPVGSRLVSPEMLPR